MPDPLEFIPGYISPLTDKEHATIGRIALLWGQIESAVEHLVCLVSGLTWDELDAIGVAGKPIAQKVDYLKATSKRLADDKQRERVVAFCISIHDTKSDRNHLFHGIWGWRADSRTKTVVPAARKTSAPSQPLKATKLPSIEKRLCRCSRMASDLLMEFWQEGYRTKYSRFFHHGERGALPEWLEQWSERNPLDDAHLDRIGKAGRLPHLDAPYPPK